MTLGGLHFNHRFAAQYTVFDAAYFGIAHHATLKQQVTGGCAYPAVDGDRRIMLAFPGQEATHTLQLLVNILHCLNRLSKQLAVVVRHHFRSRVLNQVGFASLGDKR